LTAAVTLSEIGEPPEVATNDPQQRSILDRLLLVSVNRSVLGWSLYQQGRYAEARVELPSTARSTAWRSHSERA